MAQQGVIYPAEPLLIVDRQWRRNKKGFVDAPILTLNPTKRDITISVLGKPPSRPSSNKIPATARKANTATQATQFKFVNGQPCCASTPAKRNRSHPNSSKSRTKPIITNSHSITTSLNDTRRPDNEALRLHRPVPNTCPLFYAYAGEQTPADAQELLAYCMTLILTLGLV